MTEIYAGGNRVAKLYSDGTVHTSGGALLGRVYNDGSVHVSGRQVGRFSSDGTVSAGGRQLGRVYGDGTVFVNGSQIGRTYGEKSKAAGAALILLIHNSTRVVSQGTQTAHTAIPIKKATHLPKKTTNIKQPAQKKPIVAPANSPQASAEKIPPRPRFRLLRFAILTLMLIVPGLIYVEYIHAKKAKWDKKYKNQMKQLNQKK